MLTQICAMPPAPSTAPVQIRARWIEHCTKAELEAFGLCVWQDQDEIRAGDYWVVKLSDGLASGSLRGFDP